MTLPFGGLTHLIDEQILVEWVDAETTTACTLGSCSLFNKRKTDITMKFGIEPETGQTYVYLCMAVTVLVRQKSRTIYVVLVFLPHTLQNDLQSPLPFEILETSSLTSSSFLNPSTFERADLTHLEQIIRIRFNLRSRGVVIVPEFDNAHKPSTTTSRDLFLGMKSLSTALRFNVYMRRSDYAIYGIRKLNEHLRQSTFNPLHINLVDKYNGRGAMLMDWDKFERHQQEISQKKQQPLRSKRSPTPLVRDRASLVSTIEKQLPPPPPYPTECPTRHERNVQEPQSPLIMGREELVPQNKSVVVVETLPQISANDAIPPPPSQTSDHSVPDIDEEFENVTEGLEEEIDSDEEQYAVLHARELSLARESPSVPRSLRSEFGAWLAGATTINGDVYLHQRLASRLSNLGYYASTSNATALDSTKMWCSAILFYDPTDSDIPELWNPTNRWLLSDMAKIIQWSNTFGCSPEMCLPHIRREFTKLGTAARAVAMKPQCESKLAEYQGQRAECFLAVLCEFGKPGVSGREEKRLRQS